MVERKEKNESEERGALNFKQAEEKKKGEGEGGGR